MARRHFNLETGVGMPASSRRATAPLANVSMRCSSTWVAAARVPGRASHGHQRQDDDRANHDALLGTVGLPSVRTRARISTRQRTHRVPGRAVADDELDDLLRTVAVVEDALDLAPVVLRSADRCRVPWFADLAVDVAVVEVGLGGTWDATNCSTTRVAVITNVAVDHVNYSGRHRRDRRREGRHRATGMRRSFSARPIPDSSTSSSTAVPARCCGATSTSACGRTRSPSADGLSTSTRRARVPRRCCSVARRAPGRQRRLALMTAEAFLGAPLDPDLVVAAFRRSCHRAG